MGRLLWVVLAAGLVWGGFGCASRQNTNAMDATFIRYDTNRDGVLTKEEFVQHWQDKQRADTAWKKIDQEGKGSVDRMRAKSLPPDIWGDIESENI